MRRSMPQKTRASPGPQQAHRSPGPQKAQINYGLNCGSLSTVQPFLAILALLGLVATQQPARTPDIHFTPTRHHVADAMLKLAGVTPDDVVYDLGSGDGRIPIIAAQKYGARAVGIELDPRLVELSWQIANEAEVANRVKFIVADVFEADFSNATVVTLYLSNSMLRILEPKLRALKKGTRIVAHQFAIPGWTPDQTVTVDESKLMLWKVKD